MGIQIKKCPKCGFNEWTPCIPEVKQTNVCKECCYKIPYREALARLTS